MAAMDDSFRRLQEAAAAGAGSLGAGSGSNDQTMEYMLLATAACYLGVFALLGVCAFTSRRERQPPELPLRAPQFQDSGEQPFNKTPVADLDMVWRKAFLRKVYAILGVQLLTTTALVATMMMKGGADLITWVQSEGRWTMWTAMIGSFVSLFGLQCVRHRTPHNMLVLGAFTLCESWMIGTICSMYYANGMGILVLEALALTSIIFAGLTVFTMQSKIDFSVMGPALFVSLLALIVWGLFARFFFASVVASQVYALCGVVLFSLFIVYDTHMVLKQYSYDEYIMGAIQLYLDIINLFLFILELLGIKPRDD
jgi:FtsH-binding integral membrane protein|mmetsp:Transcript_7985/g.25611  ORF Transcript_7985/g.25611 Transcript_7985/m.25611 type:complete len:312 (-) Transcript_7985:55-990(-)